MSLSKRCTRGKFQWTTETRIRALLSSQALPNQKAGFGGVVLFSSRGPLLANLPARKRGELGDEVSTKKDAAACWEDTFCISLGVRQPSNAPHRSATLPTAPQRFPLLPTAPRPACFRKQAA